MEKILVKKEIEWLDLEKCLTGDINKVTFNLRKLEEDYISKGWSENEDKLKREEKKLQKQKELYENLKKQFDK